MAKINKKLIVIVGPTASGKTSLGVFLAKKYDGEIVSADSRQVFRKLNIGTGKDLNEYNGIKYHLIDICKPGEKFTMFDWLDRARIVINDIFARGKIPVIVGGTGLYIQSLVEGFQLVPDKSQTLNSKSQINPKSKNQNYKREELDAMSLCELQSIFEKLSTRNYQLETVDIQNPRRLIRAIEKAQNAENTTKVKPDFEVIQIAPEISREELYKKIDDRVDQWFSDGFYGEVESLLKSGVSAEWLNSIGLEYKILANYIVDNPDNNLDSFDQMKQEMKFKIHQFARRQLTWFRRFPEIVWIKDKKEAFGIINDFLIQ